MTGTYKLTADFALNDPGNTGKIVRDINLTPADRRLPDVAVCRIFSSRADAETILRALENAQTLA